MIGCSLIGTPAGFESLHVGVNEEIETDSYVDLPNQEINIFPGAEIFRFQRVISHDSIYNLYSYYKHAFEINNTRPGSYYGSVISFKNSSAPAGHIIIALRELSSIIEKECLDNNNRFQKKIVTINETELPRSFQNLEGHTKEIQPPPGYSNLEMVSTKRIFCKSNKSEKDLEAIINLASDPLFIREFQCSFISADENVIGNVSQNGFLSIISVEELRDRKRKIENSRKRSAPQKVAGTKKRERSNKNNDQTSFDESHKERERDSDNYKAEGNSKVVTSTIAMISNPWRDRIIGFACGIILTLFIAFIQNRILKPEPNKLMGKNENSNAKDTISDNNKKPEKSQADCTWDKETRWVYIGPAIDLMQLVSMINDDCGKNCEDWAGKIRESLIKINATDIVDGVIKTPGNLVFNLPVHCQLKVPVFKKWE